MDVNTIASLITSVGFPIVCCIYMWNYINSTLKEFTQTMNENTRMIEKLCDRLERRDEGE